MPGACLPPSNLEGKKSSLGNLTYVIQSAGLSPLILIEYEKKKFIYFCGSKVIAPTLEILGLATVCRGKWGN